MHGALGVALCGAALPVGSPEEPPGAKATECEEQEGEGEGEGGCCAWGKAR